MISRLAYAASDVVNVHRRQRFTNSPACCRPRNRVGGCSPRLIATRAALRRGGDRLGLAGADGRRLLDRDVDQLPAFVGQRDSPRGAPRRTAVRRRTRGCWASRSRGHRACRNGRSRPLVPGRRRSNRPAPPPADRSRRRRTGIHPAGQPGAVPGRRRSHLTSHSAHAGDKPAAISSTQVAASRTEARHRARGLPLARYATGGQDAGPSVITFFEFRWLRFVAKRIAWVDAGRQGLARAQNQRRQRHQRVAPPGGQTAICFAGFHRSTVHCSTSRARRNASAAAGKRRMSCSNARGLGRQSARSQPAGPFRPPRPTDRRRAALRPTAARRRVA